MRVTTNTRINKMKFKVQFIKDRHLVALEVIQDANIDEEDKTVVNISVRIFLGGYLYAVTQHLLTRRNFLFLNSPRGFRSSLGQRDHFIHFFFITLLTLII